MTHYRSLIDNNYLGQWDLNDAQGNPKDAVVRIAKVERWNPEVKRKRKLPDGTFADEPTRRIKITFAGKRKAWLAGPVSQKAIADIYGNDVNNWIGKSVTLYADPGVMMGGKRVGGIRVRPSIPRGSTTDETLDNQVDEEVKGRLDEAFGRTREPGED